MTYMHKIIGTGIMLFFMSLATGCRSSVEEGKALECLTSPDGRLKMEFLLSSDGTPHYSLSHDGEAVVLPSALGFELRGSLKASVLRFGDRMEKVDEKPPYSLHDAFVLIGSETDSFDETWTPVWGEESSIRNHYNELLVHLEQNGTGNRMDIRFRLFDELPQTAAS